LTVETAIDGEHSRRIAEIVGEALRLPPGELPAFLDEACGGDAVLRRQVEALLAAREQPLSEEPLRVLSHYRILGRLGSGGMGEVYLAEDQKLGRRVALKVLPPELAQNPQRLARFRREARVVAALNHPNIVTLHSIEEDQGVPFLTMERVEGVTLRDKIVPGGLPADELLRLALPLADAVAAAHAQGITHRDLKPANVMISGDGRLKVLDFGLARRTLEDGGASADLTVDGRVLGTVPYMSPEQAKGFPVDCRSDVFSLGTVLYELATGEHPFAAPSPAETVSKILRDTPEPAAGLPPALRSILDRCLQKDPDLRYQNAGELRDALRSMSPPLPEGGRGWERGARGVRGTLAAAICLILALAAAFWWTHRARHEAPAPAPERTAIAVLHFQNLTGDPKLDWLRTGLTEMLVTDLSQSPQLDILGTDRLYQILADVGALGNQPASFDTVQTIARRAAVQQVIRGSYARVGDHVLVSFQIEDAASGKILGSDRVQGPGDEQLLSLMDALVASVHRHLTVAPPPTAAATMQEVTTSSVEAWRLYTEALNLQNQAKDPEAIPLLEKAVQVDPSFALALNDLGTLHGNLGHQGLAAEYSRRAVEKADRLPLHLRFLVQGRYDSGKWSTYGKAMESFQEALRLYPNRSAPRNNLAAIETFLERYDDALRDYEMLLAQGTRFAPTAVSAANTDAALGRFEDGHKLLLDLAARNPESWLAQVGLGWHLTLWGKLDEAAAALDRAAALRPGDPTVLQARWRLAVLREDWPRAEQTARDLASLDDPYAKWRGALSLARNATYRGAAQKALDHLAAATRAYPQPEAFTAMAHVWTADLLLDLGQPARALTEARQAQALAPGDWPELQGLFLAALAQQKLGHLEAADAILAALKRRAAVTPNSVEQRQILRLEGLLALARGDADGAVASLQKAAALLPPRGVEIHWHVQPDHVPIWYALGQAEQAAGHPDLAGKWFQKAAASGAEHIEFPLAYLRSREAVSPGFRSGRPERDRAP
jgi:tetratricopeptide (TPR) repeat protein/TolB-like protein/tRNA A-37 threonylcarbamoyl transferase component Bud32